MGETSKMGKRIHDLRVDHDQSQEVFANLLGVSQSSVQRWETGGSVNSEALLKISEIYDVSIDWLLTGVGTENIKLHNTTGLEGTSIEALQNNSGLAKAINYLINIDCGFMIPAIASYLATRVQLAEDRDTPFGIKIEGRNFSELMQYIMIAQRKIGRGGLKD